MVISNVNTAGVFQLIQRHRWAEAKQAAESLLQAQPTNPQLHAYRGLCYFHEENWAIAAESFHRATCLDPQYWQAASRLAQCYERLHEYRKGLDVCEEFVKVNPNDPALESLLEYFQDMAKLPLEGWERSAHLAYHVVLAQQPE